jgi:hypothetical protein
VMEVRLHDPGSAKAVIVVDGLCEYRTIKRAIEHYLKYVDQPPGKDCYFFPQTLMFNAREIGRMEKILRELRAIYEPEEPKNEV